MPLPYDDFDEQATAALLLLITLMAQQDQDLQERAKYDAQASQDRANLHMAAVHVYQASHALLPNAAVTARAHALQREIDADIKESR